MEIGNFNFAASPKVIFEAGCFSKLYTYIKPFGSKALVLTGHRSLKQNKQWPDFVAHCQKKSLSLFHWEVGHEPTPDLIDRIVLQYGNQSIDVVVAIGGGSVLDTGKAVSAMLPLGTPVIDYLEGIGHKQHPGVKRPFIALPTTAGTGAEATKNASIRSVGTKGFKNSLRHDRFVPDLAVIDPALALSCPAPVTAACGMDALAQLMESYVSPLSSPVTDALAQSGLRAIGQAFINAVEYGADDLFSRSAMAYAAFASGLCLANAGLGMVHGLSSLIGGYCPISHGIICGRLIAPGTQKNIELLNPQIPGHQIALEKHAVIATLLLNRSFPSVAKANHALIELLYQWTDRFSIPSLRTLGMNDEVINNVTHRARQRQNPVPMERQDIRRLLEKA